MATKDNLKLRRPDLRITAILHVALIALAVSGCVLKLHGNFDYKVSGRLLDGGEPLNNKRVAIALTEFAVVPAYTAVTGNQAEFAEVAVTALGWGCSQIVGLPKNSSCSPPPPTLEELNIDALYVALEVAPGEWRQFTVPVTRKDQPSPGFVTLGEVDIRSRQLSLLPHP